MHSLDQNLFDYTLVGGEFGSSSVTKAKK